MESTVSVKLRFERPLAPYVDEIARLSREKRMETGLEGSWTVEDVFETMRLNKGKGKNATFTPFENYAHVESVVVELEKHGFLVNVPLPISKADSRQADITKPVAKPIAKQPKSAFLSSKRSPASEGKTGEAVGKHPKRRKKDAEIPLPTKIICSKCTFENNARKRKCEMCQTSLIGIPIHSPSNDIPTLHSLRHQP